MSTTEYEEYVIIKNEFRKVEGSIPEIMSLSEVEAAVEKKIGHKLVAINIDPEKNRERARLALIKTERLMSRPD